MGRTGRDVRADVADAAQTTRVFADVDDIDAVASDAGDVPYNRLIDMTPEDYLSAYRGKVPARMELVRQSTSKVVSGDRPPSSPGFLGRSRSSPQARRSM